MIWNGYLEIFSCPQAIENCIGNICFSEQIFYTKQSLGAPEKQKIDSNSKRTDGKLLSLEISKSHNCPSVG